MDGRNTFRVKLTNFKRASHDLFTDHDPTLPRSIYSNKIDKWGAGSHNHDCYALGVLVVEYIKGTYDFRKDIKT